MWSQPEAGPPATGWFLGMRLAGRVLVALLSGLVLLGTWYGWAHYRNLLDGLVTGDVTTAEGDGSTDILLVGTDSRTDARGNPLPAEVREQLNAGDSTGSLTDTIILLHIPHDGSRAVGFSFPRDSYVAIPGHGQQKINSAYQRGEQERAQQLAEHGATDPEQAYIRSANAGRELLVRTVQNLTGVSVDHYAEVNLLGFARITEALGGVPVCLNNPVQESLSGADFEAGEQRLSGPEALAFVRQRHDLPRGDLDRVVRQQAFLSGLANSGMSSEVLGDPERLREVVDAVERSVVLDQDWNMVAFADRVQGLSDGSVEFNTIPIEDAAYQTSDGEEAVLVDPEQVRQAVQRGIADPMAEAEPTVHVYNGTPTTGMAARMRVELAGQDFVLGEIGDVPTRADTAVEYAPDSQHAAEQVADHLGGPPTTANSALPPGEVRVLLGADAPAWNTPRMAGAGTVMLDGATRQGVRSESPITADEIPCVN